MILWALFVVSIAAMDLSTQRFQSCQNEECILIQCYFPIEQFLDTTRNELSGFEEFFTRNHLFISYHLCTDLSAENFDEVGACIYGVLFKLYQYDANMTVHQRVHIQQAAILEESTSVVIDMICTLLYRIQSIDNRDDMKTIIDQVRDEDLVVINRQALTPRAHLTASKIILNYGQWFTFIYGSTVNDCLYEIHSFDRGLRPTICATEQEIVGKLEHQWTTKPKEWKSVRSYHDLTHMNVFERTLSTFFFIDKSTSTTPFSYEKITIIPVDISTFPVTEIVNHPALQGPYPFVLFWSVKKNRLQRLGDNPSLELIELLLDEEGQASDLRNSHGMIDDEVRHLADRFEEIEINPKVIFLRAERDYPLITQEYPQHAVLFTVKWDSTSKLARRTFHQIASRLPDSIALMDIDCFDWTDICHEGNIVEWPTLMVTGKEGKADVYRGSTDADEMALFLFRSTVNQPYEISPQANVTSIGDLLKRQRVVVLARIQSQEKSLLETYQNLVDLFRQNEQVFFMLQFSDESSSLIIREKAGDLKTLFQPKTTVHSLDDDIDRLKSVIHDALRSSWVLFDAIDLLQSTPTTFVAASRSQLEQVKNTVNSAIPSGFLPIVWIDTNSPWILTVSEYGEIAYPAVIYLDLDNGFVYVTSTFDDIAVWFDAVQKKSIPFFYKLAPADLIDRPSQKEIDFNQQTNDEESLNDLRVIQEISQEINEHGLGFDSDGLPIVRQG